MKIETSRRSFLRNLFVAPAIISAANLMPVKAYAHLLEPKSVPYLSEDWMNKYLSPEYNLSALTPQGVAMEALERTLRDHLFEPNDIFTRSKITAEAQAYLNALKSQRKIYDFLVVCEESNNPYWYVSNNELRADIYIRPTRAVNYIQLSAISTLSGINLESMLHID